MRLRHRISVLAIALPIAGSLATAQSGPPAAAPPSPVTSAVRPIDSPAPDGSAQPNLASDRRGRVWLTWLEARQTGGGHRFRAAQLTGNRWTEPVTIAEDTNFLANWADFPSLFVASDGTLAAHWLERTTGREAYFVRIRTSNDAGRTWSPTITPHKDTSATEHGFVSFFDAPGGGVGLVWLDGREMSGGHAAGGHSTWTFFWVAGGALLTPPLEDRILNSITRARVMEEAAAQEAVCTLDDVRGAEEAFIASSVREVMPIAAVDDIELPSAPGPVTEAARERLAKRIERELGAPA